MNNGKQPITPSMWTKNGSGENDYQPLKDGQKTGYEVKFGGLTKREHFAAMVLQGMYSNNGLVDQWDCENIMALNAVKAADALLEALNK